MYSIEEDDLTHNLRVGRRIIHGEEVTLSCKHQHNYNLHKHPKLIKYPQISHQTWDTPNATSA